jgi:hypothetical protein
MQLEGDPFYEMAEIVCSSDLVRICFRCSTADGDSPFVCMIG